MKTPFSLLNTIAPNGYLILLLPLLMLVGYNSSAEPQFRLGEDYKVLQIPVRGEKASVVHGFFSYRSAESYRRYLEVSQWSRTVQNVSVLYYPQFIDQQDEPLARLFLMIEQLEQPQPLHVALFEAVQAGDTNWQDKLKVETFLVDHGVTKSRFRELWNSEQVELLLRNTRALVKIYRIKKTPAIIVNGKYLTDLSPSNNAGQSTMVGSGGATITPLIEYLLEKDKVVQTTQTQTTQGVLR